MRILLVADKYKSALWRLCEYTAQALPHHETKILDFHPKRPSEKQLNEMEDALAWADIFDCRYWKTAEKIKALFHIPQGKILTHCNPYDVQVQPWAEYDINVCVNKSQMKDIIGASRLIPLPVDFNKFLFDPDFDKLRLNNVLMVANRVESNKGIVQVAKAAKELGKKLILVGRPSKPDYLKEVLAVGNVDLRVDLSDEDLVSAYLESAALVVNSVDHFESGTMPALEAMACGTPVVTRMVGHIPDIYNGQNMSIINGQPDDIEQIKLAIQKVTDNIDLAKKMRLDAFESIRTRNIVLYGLMYDKLYHELANKKSVIDGEYLPTVSVVIPTINDIKTILKTIHSVYFSDYHNIEIIISDNGDAINEGAIDVINKTFRNQLAAGMFRTIKVVKSDKYISYQEKYTSPQKVKFIDTKYRLDYGIAHARNMGMMEAVGEYLLFLDDRLEIEPQAIDYFVKKRANKFWQWGVKDGIKKGFVENFSFVNRRNLIDIGGFSSCITQYGGMTQETRKRAEVNRFSFEINSAAQCKSYRKSSNKYNKRLDIIKSKTQCVKLGYA